MKKKFFLEHVAKYCDKCGTAYQPENLEILQNNNYSTIIHFFCENCKASQMATFIQPLGVSSRMPVNTDLVIDEISSFSQKSGISSNEILDVHELLSNGHVTVEDILKYMPKAKITKQLLSR
ncbi:hypothetical protein JW887_02085 [Candidatus Dojkabacteria bacterium]|nr:hypothetical protein [Candidatus Dojkabacteria bacterium]